MTAAPLVTVVTPVLNAVSSIGLCLASVAGQTYRRIEHIVVDGGSADGTLDVIRSHAERDTLTLISESDTGMYDAVNKGLALARGDVLAYLNADDAYMPWTVETAVEAMSPRTDFCYGDLGVVSERHEKGFMPHFYPTFDPALYTHHQRLAQPTVFWRRSAYERLGPFDDSFRLVADCEYWIRAGIAGCSFKHVEEVIAIQFDHPQTLRNRLPDNLTDEFERIRIMYKAQVGPPDRFAHLSTALGWRGRMAQFYISYQMQHPRRWKRFLSWLKENEIRPTRDFLRGFLPSSMWSQLPAFADGDEVVRALRQTLSDGSPHDLTGSFGS